ncbi:MAG: hypothetical protein WAM60_15935 [Candidatus Promineifilaceae bacterium]
MNYRERIRAERLKLKEEFSQLFEAFLAELAPYVAAKRSIRLPLDKPVPYELIVKLVKIRVEQNLAKVNK